jgi:hypothetical protein
MGRCGAFLFLRAHLRGGVVEWGKRVRMGEWEALIDR